MKILKFGGTSVSKPQKIIEIIKSYKDVAVVLSAFSGITNKLIETANLAAKKDKKYLNFNYGRLRSFLFHNISSYC